MHEPTKTSIHTSLSNQSLNNIMGISINGVPIHKSKTEDHINSWIVNSQRKLPIFYFLIKLIFDQKCDVFTPNWTQKLVYLILGIHLKDFFETQCNNWPL